MVEGSKYTQKNTDLILERYYEALLRLEHNPDNTVLMDELDIPQSDVFYARAAIRNKLGITLSLEKTKMYMKEEFGYDLH